MAQGPIFSPVELGMITDCTLQYHFWRQTPAEPEAVALAEVVGETIAYLHAAGGPQRLNLPATLRDMTRFIPAIYQDNVPFQTAARQMTANYHRRLKTEWARVIASNEAVALNIRLGRGLLQVEGVVERVDKEEEGGITAVQFKPSPRPIPTRNLETDIETTLWHALAAAAYPDKRPVRVKYLWLYHNREEGVELSEKQYRANLEKVKGRAQAWLGGEILARPGPYCAACPFKYRGCPVYQNEIPADLPETLTEEEAADLPDSPLSATFLARNQSFAKDGDFVENKTDP